MERSTVRRKAGLDMLKMSDKNQLQLDQFGTTSEISHSPISIEIDDQLDLILQHIRKTFNFKKNIIIQFYPFTGFRNTGKHMDGGFRIRISHLLKDAPSDIIFAIIASFIARQTNRSPKKYVKLFRDYVKTDRMKEKLDDYRKNHARKRLRGDEGKFVNLRNVFDQMNTIYFDQMITDVTLTWGQRSYRTLGHYDRAMRTIVISQCLDDPKIPPYIVEYVVYHEMLHHCLPMKYVNGRRKIHTQGRP